MSKFTIPTMRNITQQEIDRFADNIIKAKTIRVNVFTFKRMHGYFLRNKFDKKIEINNKLDNFEVEFDFKNEPKSSAIEACEIYDAAESIVADAVIDEEIKLERAKNE